MYEGGIANMRYSISNTAEFGDYTRGPRIITDETKAEMKRVLDDIQSGRFARDWVQECQAGQPSFKAMRRRSAEHSIEEVGARLRAMMPWIAANRLVDGVDGHAHYVDIGRGDAIAPIPEGAIDRVSARSMEVRSEEHTSE